MTAPAAVRTPMRTGSRATTVAALAGISCGVGWLTKMVVIGVLGPDHVLVAVFWAVGMASWLVACGAAAAAVLAGRRWPLRAVAAVVAVPLGFVVMSLTDTATKGLYDGTGWFRDEVSLVVLATVALVAGVSVLVRRGSS